jgi:hypothetical protein
MNLTTYIWNVLHMEVVIQGIQSFSEMTEVIVIKPHPFIESSIILDIPQFKK